MFEEDMKNRFLMRAKWCNLEKWGEIGGDIMD